MPRPPKQPMKKALKSREMESQILACKASHLRTDSQAEGSQVVSKKWGSRDEIVQDN